MADKRDVKRSIKRLQRVKTWQLIALLIIVAFVAATFLRLNNIGMLERRNAVLVADEAGEEEVIRSRVYALQRYSSHHMNADTGAFYLEHQYRRDAQAAVDRVKDYDNPNGNINAQAEAVCKPRFDTWSPAYVQCFVEELSKHPPAPNPDQNVQLPDTNLYRYSFNSPLWSPDFAGWSVLACLAIGVVIIVRLVSMAVLQWLLKRNYRGI